MLVFFCFYRPFILALYSWTLVGRKGWATTQKCSGITPPASICGAGGVKLELALVKQVPKLSGPSR